jgi:hypothetical protein
MLGSEMTALVLHLSDIHVQSVNDPILARHKLIANVLNPHLPSASAVFIVASGDIAQSGQEEEYTGALRFFERLRTDILSEKNLPVEFVIAPGNHDCDFSGEQTVRNLVLKEIPSQFREMPDPLIKASTDVQKNFFEFRKKLISSEPLFYEDALWSIQEFKVEGKVLWFDCVNTAWMSSKTEKQGALIFPLATYKEFKGIDADLRIGIMHHPLNWLSQICYGEVRGLIHALEDVIFTGHEHIGNAGVREEAASGECAYVEGCALQTKDQSKSEFNLVVLELLEQKISVEKFLWHNNRYEGTTADEWMPVRAMPKRAEVDLQITAAFQAILKDPGATLHHPDKPNLMLDDFYVFPDIDIPGNERRNVKTAASISKKRNSRTLTNIAALEPNIVLEGAENCGKTRLLFQLFSTYHSQNYLPLYLDAIKIKSSTPAELERLFSAAIVDQYGQKNVASYQQAPSEKKILLLDNFDQCPLNAKYKGALYEFIGTGFKSRILTVSENFEINEILAEEKLTAIAEFARYRILSFGFERRGELVRKWNKIGSTEVTSTNEWLEACDHAEKLIETTRLRHVVIPP